MADQKMEIKIDVLNLMHLYSTVKDFIDITDETKGNEKSFNYHLLKEAFTELEDQINRNYNENLGDYCAERYDKLKNVFDGDK